MAAWEKGSWRLGIDWEVEGEGRERREAIWVGVGAGGLAEWVQASDAVQVEPDELHRAGSGLPCLPSRT